MNDREAILLTFYDPRMLNTFKGWKISNNRNIFHVTFCGDHCFFNCPTDNNNKKEVNVDPATLHILQRHKCKMIGERVCLPDTHAHRGRAGLTVSAVDCCN